MVATPALHVYLDRHKNIHAQISFLPPNAATDQICSIQKPKFSAPNYVAPNCIRSCAANLQTPRALQDKRLFNFFMCERV